MQIKSESVLEVNNKYFDLVDSHKFNAKSFKIKYDSHLAQEKSEKKNYFVVFMLIQTRIASNEV